tara:strand:- start:301 stop:441 length:141 start_codon:yes stop_codon:yes gene_type:complete
MVVIAGLFYDINIIIKILLILLKKLKLLEVQNFLYIFEIHTTSRFP